MPPAETGRTRAARIPLDYFKHPTRLDWGRGWWALGLAVVVALGALTTGWLGGGQGQGYYSRGPVAVVHATWDNQCNACHTPFAPLGGEAWAGRFGDVHALNQKCEACHQGPAHHDRQVPELACAACHHDHRGRDASLVRLSDSACTQCHADLQNHLKEASLAFQEQVTAFAGGNHPEFKVLRDKAKDPGRLAFNHKRHLAPGMATPEGGDPNFTLGRIAPDERERYRRPGQGDDSRVTLDCGSCHRQDSGDFGIRPELLGGIPVDAVLPLRAVGAAMLPITYENQCKACHPLTYERRDANDPRSGHVSVPHRLQPAQLHEYLEGHYTAEFLKGNAGLFQQPVPLRPLPGQLPEAVAKEAIQVIRGKVTAAERMLYAGRATCGECHRYEQAEGNVVPERIVPTAVPQVWFQHAVFSHVAHRAVDCRQCHAGAETSIDQADLLLPGIATCLKCHAPETGSGTTRRGGARFDCTECHRYHNGDNPGQGIGAQRRSAARSGSIDDFLSGRSP